MKLHPIVLLVLLTDCHWSSPVSPDLYGNEVQDAGGASQKDELETEDLLHSHGNDAAVSHYPTTCPEGWACNELLDEQGLCHGLCIRQEQVLTCPVSPELGLCVLVPQFVYANTSLSCDRILLEPVDYPNFVIAHSEARVAIRVTNRSLFNLSLPFRYKSPDTWEIVGSNFQELTEIALAPKETKTLEARMVPHKANLFEGGGPMLTVAIGESCEFSVFTIVTFDKNEEIQCGNFAFPSSYCIGDCGIIGQFYGVGKCCGECFFPGAECCSNEDCNGGACFDGKCVFETPKWPLANTLPAGNIRALVVVLDNPEVAPSLDICENRLHEMPFAEKLQKVEEFFDRMQTTRTGKKTLSWKWTVLAGISSDDFITNHEDYLYSRFIDRTEEYLVAQGCEPFANYDKVIVVSPKAKMLGTAGQAMDRGRIVTVALEPFLCAHELAHTFGASDLYVDLGGHYQWVIGLMGNNLGGLGYPQDVVMWGEIGFGDHDRNQVIDVFEFEWFPEEIEVHSLKAVLTRKRTLEIRFEFSANHKKLFLSDFSLRLLDFNVSKEVHLGAQKKVVVFDEFEVPIEKVKKEGLVRLVISAVLRYTDKDWQRKELLLDKAFEVEVIEE